MSNKNFKSLCFNKLLLNFKEVHLYMCVFTNTLKDCRVLFDITFNGDIF